ncbi:MAG: mechanosensitive ion channel family protein, partial [Candidatus Thorarchaeota archaeon]
IMRSIRVSFRRVGVPAEATTGVRLMVRLLFFGIGVSVILTATTVLSGTAVITGGAIFGTAIGLAFARALSNMVSGFYMLAARPFRVGDYVRIGDIEGIVYEFTLNYTRLKLPDMNMQLVPNSKVVESEVTNFRVRVDELMYERGVEQEKQEQRGKIRLTLGDLKNLAKGDEVYRYTFDVQVHKEYSFKKVLEYFNEVCDKHASYFIEKPEIMYWANQSLAIIYRIAFIVQKPMEILTVGADLQAEIANFHEVMR